MGFSKAIPDIGDFEFMHCLWSITQRKMLLHCTINKTARATARSFTIKMEIAKHSKCLKLSQPQLKLQPSKLKSLSHETMMKILILQQFLLVMLKRTLSSYWSSLNNSDATCWFKHCKNTMYIIHNIEIHKTTYLKKMGPLSKISCFHCKFLCSSNMYRLGL